MIGARHARRGACALAALLVAMTAASCVRGAGADELVRVRVAHEISVADVPRVGVNLGERSAWGAEQLARNVVLNPGFEGIVDRAIVVVARSSRGAFSDSEPWLARPDGFWSGGRYEILTGPNAGQGGEILDSRRAGADGLPVHLVASRAPLPRPGAAVAVTRVSDDSALAKWKTPEDARGLVTTRREVRPGSPGRRSLLLRASDAGAARVLHFLDTIGDRAGKLLPLTGRWRLTFWARAEGRTEARRGALRVHLWRSGAAPLVDEELAIDGVWRRHQIEIDARDDGPPGAIELGFEARGGRSILVDDVVLERIDGAAGFPRPEVVAALSALRPGHVRDWQGQLGDTIDNRLAGPFARRPTRYRPGGPEATHFGYSIPELFEICDAVGASPWIVMPPTFGAEEAGRLGAFLRDHAARDRFAEVVVEFGNECWNGVFRPGSIPDTRTYAEAAASAFAALRAAAGEDVRLVRVAGGRVDDVAFCEELRAALPEVEAIGVAPYLLRRLDESASRRLPHDALFARLAPSFDALSSSCGALGRELAIYEVNLHTLGGTASSAYRDAVVAGAASGAALVARLLEANALGARRQCVYSLAGFDAFTDGGRTLTKLFGVTRDLAGAPRLRPTGLALSLVNRVLPGHRHALAERDEARAIAAGLHLAAFASPRGFGAVVASSSAKPRRLAIELPDDGAPPAAALALVAPAATATNEDADEVAIEPWPLRAAGRIVEVEVPPYGVVALVPRGGRER